MTEFDALVIGSGPNGLAAAVTLARAGLSVRVYESAETYGGGLRTAELTLPGFHHDACSAVHPLALASGFFRAFRLTERVRFVTPDVSYAHPLDNGRGAVAYRNLETTVRELGADGAAWRSLLEPLVARADHIAQFTGSALLPAPQRPLAGGLFGISALSQAGGWWNARWKTAEAAALLTGTFAHSAQPLPSLAAAAAGLSLATMGHARGWPIPVGGSQTIADALATDLRAHGGDIVTGIDVHDLSDLPSARAILFDTHIHDAVRIAGSRLRTRHRTQAARVRSGPGVFTLHFALDGPVPWAYPHASRTATVHLGGTRAEIALSEAHVNRGRESENPYVLVSQPSLFDTTRAPTGRHVLWTYTHVPGGSTSDRSEAIIRQIERFAPGFRDRILAQHSRTARELEAENPNNRGGDISGGAPTVRQLVARPTVSAEPWRMPGNGLYLASASAAPGPGVHGLAGYYAARSALRHEFGIHTMPSLAPETGEYPSHPDHAHDRVWNDEKGQE